LVQSLGGTKTMFCRLPKLRNLGGGGRRGTHCILKLNVG